MVSAKMEQCCDESPVLPERSLKVLSALRFESNKVTKWTVLFQWSLLLQSIFSRRTAVAKSVDEPLEKFRKGP